MISARDDERVIAGVLLVVGSLLFFVAIVLIVSLADPSGRSIVALPDEARLPLIAANAARWEWGWAFGIAGIVVTALGLVADCLSVRNGPDRRGPGTRGQRRGLGRRRDCSRRPDSDAAGADRRLGQRLDGHLHGTRLRRPRSIRWLHPHDGTRVTTSRLGNRRLGRWVGAGVRRRMDRRWRLRLSPAPSRHAAGDRSDAPAADAPRPAIAGRGQGLEQP